MSFVLEARHLSKRFGAFEALKSVTLEIQEGEIHAIMGENGAGKSTLLKTLFGLQRPTSGSVFFRGNEVRWQSPLEAIGAGVGMVQQHFALVDELSALDNIFLGLEPLKHGFILDRKSAIEALEALLPSNSLRVPWNDLVSTLSVGQKQRVEILKLLYRKSKVLFLDEPTAVLAPHEVADFFELLKGLRKSGHTIVIITHKIAEAFSICDRFTILRNGRVAGSGEISAHTRDDLVRMMIGRVAEAPTVSEPPARQNTALLVKDLRENQIGRGSLRALILTSTTEKLLELPEWMAPGKLNWLKRS